MAAGSPAPAWALDAASRGLSVALLERRDLAHGTSRWSSKLVHGGLRYLEHGEWGLAWESAVERATLMRTVAPHLIRSLPFLIPLDAAIGRRAAAKATLGLRIGDGLRTAARTSRRALPPPRRVSALEARRLAPALPATGLRGALLSWDGQLEDDARLVIAIARTAAAHGARILTYAGVTGLREDGVEAVDGRTGAAFTVRARHTAVAAGVWTGALTEAVALSPSRGSHLLVRAERLGDPRAAVSMTGARRARALGVRAPPHRRPRRDRAHRRPGPRRAGRRPAAGPGRGDRAPGSARPPLSTCRSAPTTSPAATPGCARWPPERRTPRPPTCRAGTRS